MIGIVADLDLRANNIPAMGPAAARDVQGPRPLAEVAINLALNSPGGLVTRQDVVDMIANGKRDIFIDGTMQQPSEPVVVDEDSNHHWVRNKALGIARPARVDASQGFLGQLLAWMIKHGHGEIRATDDKALQHFPMDRVIAQAVTPHSAVTLDAFPVKFHETIKEITHFAQVAGFKNHSVVLPRSVNLMCQWYEDGKLPASDIENEGQGQKAEELLRLLREMVVDTKTPLILMVQD